MRKLWRRPSPAMVVACAALLVALSGTGMAAATQLARNSVGTPQLKDGAVANAKIKNNAVNSAKVAARSLLRSDFAPGQLPAGPVGPQGPAGPQGAAGPAGPAGAIGAVTVRQASVERPGIVRRQADGCPTRAQHVVGHPDGRRAAATPASGRCRPARAGARTRTTSSSRRVYMKPVFQGTGPVTGFTAKGANNARDGRGSRVHALRPLLRGLNGS